MSAPTNIRQQQLKVAYDFIGNDKNKIDLNKAKQVAMVLRKSKLIHGLIHAQDKDQETKKAIEKWLKSGSFAKSLFTGDNAGKNVIDVLLEQDSITLMYITEDVLQFMEELIRAATIKSKTT